MSLKAPNSFRTLKMGNSSLQNSHGRRVKPKIMGLCLCSSTQQHFIAKGQSVLTRLRMNFIPLEAFSVNRTEGLANIFT